MSFIPTARRYGFIDELGSPFPRRAGRCRDVALEFHPEHTPATRLPCDGVCVARALQWAFPETVSERLTNLPFGSGLPRAIGEVATALGVWVHPEPGLRLDRRGMYLVYGRMLGEPHVVLIERTSETPLTCEVIDGVRRRRQLWLEADLMALYHGAWDTADVVTYRCELPDRGTPPETNEWNNRLLAITAAAEGDEVPADGSQSTPPGMGGEINQVDEQLRRPSDTSAADDSRASTSMYAGIISGMHDNDREHGDSPDLATREGFTSHVCDVCVGECSCSCARPTIAWEGGNVSRAKTDSPRAAGAALYVQRRTVTHVAPRILGMVIHWYRPSSRRAPRRQLEMTPP